jgi:hypothetical protein
MSLTSPSKDIKVEPKGPVVTSRKVNGPLVFFGIVLLVAFGYGVFFVRHNGSVVNETPASSESGGTTGATGQTQATAKTTTTKNAPSDSLLTAVLGVGGALLIVGILYGRISTIKLPGGVELTLTKEEEVETVKKAVEQNPDDPDMAAKVAQRAQALLLQEKAAQMVPPADTETMVTHAVGRASQDLS